VIFSTVRALRRAVAALAVAMAWVAGWTYIACALFVTADVVGRSFLGVSSAATVEITGYMLAGGIAWGLAHALAERAHIRLDVWVKRLPLRARVPLHLFALALLCGFATFAAWAAWELVDESALFGARDNSALRLPLVIPQGIWAAGITALAVMAALLFVEGALLALAGDRTGAERLLAPRSVDDETEEALEAAGLR